MATRKTRAAPRRDRKKMVQAVLCLRAYMEGYARQPGFEGYSFETLIDDVLFGLGIAIDQETYGFADGYDRFKQRLRGHLGTGLPPAPAIGFIPHD